MSIFDYNPPGSFWQDWVRDEMFNFHTKRALTDPKAQAKIVGIETDMRPPLFGPEVREIAWLPDGDEGFVIAASIVGCETVVLPKYNRYGERAGLQALRKTPFYTRHCLGIREAARARRRARREAS